MKSFTSNVVVLLAAAAGPALAYPYNATSTTTNQTFSSSTPVNGTGSGGLYSQALNSSLPVPLSGLGTTTSTTPPVFNATGYSGNANISAQAMNANIPVSGATTSTAQQAFNVTGTGNTGNANTQTVNGNTTLGAVNPASVYNGTSDYRRPGPNHYHDKNNNMQPFDWRKHHQLKNPRLGMNNTNASSGSTVTTPSNSIPAAPSNSTPAAPLYSTPVAPLNSTLTALSNGTGAAFSNNTDAAFSKRQWGSNDEMTGRATYYFQGGAAGACGTVHSDSDQIVALSVDLFEMSYCGMWISIYPANEPWNVQGGMVADKCMGCGTTDIDLSESLFGVITDSDWGMGVFEANWFFN